MIYGIGIVAAVGLGLGLWTLWYRRSCTGGVVEIVMPHESQWDIDMRNRLDKIERRLDRLECPHERRYFKPIHPMFEREGGVEVCSDCMKVMGRYKTDKEFHEASSAYFQSVADAEMEKASKS